MGGLIIHDSVIGVWFVESRAKEPMQKEAILSLYSTGIRGL